MTLPSGTRFGPYQILAPLGAGGMGEVYRARDSRLGRDVAIKILSQSRPASADERARLRREARAISSLNHPHICVLHDIGQEGDADFIVMELIEGETLSRRIAKGPISTADVLRIGVQIAAALDCAHRSGVVHRDLKPGNVMLTKSGAKLMDFGLARAFKPEAHDPDATLTDAPHRIAPDETITRKGTIVGTFQYMAPEQLEGKIGDARSDVWALGCLLYEMATGARAFEGSSPISVISAIMRGEPRPVSELAPITPPSLEWIVKACLAKDPDERFQAAHDVQLQLKWITSTQHEALGGKRAIRRPSLVVLSLGTALLLSTALGSYALWQRRDPTQRFAFEPMNYRPMAVFSAAFSPKGGAVVFSAADQGNIPRLYVRRPEYPDPEPIGNPGIHLLSTSTQGELAVLTGAEFLGDSKFAGTLARMPIGGGAPREILQGVMEADWDPAGAQLAVVHRSAIEYPIGKVLYQSNTGYVRDLRFDPKGGRIAFIENTSGRWGPGSGLKVVDLKGRSRSLLNGYALTGLAWAPDGQSILVSGMIDSTTDAIYRVDMSGTSRMLLQSAGGLRIHDVSYDGKLLTTRDDIRGAVMVHRPEWKQDRDLSWLDGSGGGVLSRDGSTVVFTEQSSTVGGDRGVVCVRKSSGSPVVQLARGVNYTISPNENWVITVDLERPQTLVMQPLGIGEARRLPRGSIDTFYGAWWFPSGDSLLIMGQESGRPFRLYIQSLSGGKPRVFTEEGTLQPAIAPDGKFVLVRRGPKGYARYWFDGRPPEPIATLTRKDTLLPTMVNSRTALVAPGRALPYRVDQVDLATGSRKLFVQVSPHDQTGLTYCRIMGFAGDLRSYAYEATWCTSSLFMVTPEQGSH